MSTGTNQEYDNIIQELHERSQNTEWNWYSNFFKDMITQLFKRIKKVDPTITTRQNFLCCSSCAQSQFSIMKVNKGIFYHHQDAEHIPSHYLMIRYFCFDDNEDNKETRRMGNIITEQAEQVGFDVAWNGDPENCIAIYLPENFLVREKQYKYTATVVIENTSKNGNVNKEDFKRDLQFRLQFGHGKIKSIDNFTKEKI